MNTQQGEKELDRSYVKRINKLILKDEPLGDEAKLLGAVSGLKKWTKLWGRMTTVYPINYADFRRRASNIIHTAELLES